MELEESHSLTSDYTKSYSYRNSTVLGTASLSGAVPSGHITPYFCAAALDHCD